MKNCNYQSIKPFTYLKEIRIFIKIKKNSVSIIINKLLVNFLKIENSFGKKVNFNKKK